MSSLKFAPLLALLVGVGTLLTPEVTRACAVCFGDSQAQINQGINLAILTMLGVTGSVLGGFGAFFLYLRKRTKLLARYKQTGLAEKAAELGAGEEEVW